jgi:hypothetical protein
LKQKKTRSNINSKTKHRKHFFCIKANYDHILYEEEEEEEVEEEKKSYFEFFSNLEFKFFI